MCIRDRSPAAHRSAGTRWDATPGPAGRPTSSGSTAPAVPPGTSSVPPSMFLQAWWSPSNPVLNNRLRSDGGQQANQPLHAVHTPVSYTHLRAHETVLELVCRLLLEKKNTNNTNNIER